MKNRINKLKGHQARRTRSIDWIGSAWKSLAGTPDAADWNEILKSEQRIVDNNNQQYIVNMKLFNTTQAIIGKVNTLIERFNNERCEPNPNY